MTHRPQPEAARLRGRGEMWFEFSSSSQEETEGKGQFYFKISFVPLASFVGIHWALRRRRSQNRGRMQNQCMNVWEKKCFFRLFLFLCRPLPFPSFDVFPFATRRMRNKWLLFGFRIYYAEFLPRPTFKRVQLKMSISTHYHVKSRAAFS